jgi:hypothetical protein
LAFPGEFSGRGNLFCAADGGPFQDGKFAKLLTDPKFQIMLFTETVTN